MTRAALFDLDGVLIDTEGIYTRLWGDIGQRYRPDIPDFAAIIKGNTLRRILDTYFPDPTISSEVVTQLRGFEATMTYDPFPGAVEFVNSLREAGFRTAIVTSSGTDKMSHLAHLQPQLLQAFDTIVTAADVTRSKPAPEGYLLAARRLNVAPSDCFVFEDSLSGLQAGRDSGAKVIALATTLPTHQLQGHADFIFDNLAALTPQTLLSL